MDNNDRIPNLYHGHCAMGVCGEEAACQAYPNNTFTCLCPHDTLPPTSDGKCRRNVVPMKPNVIVIHQQPNNTVSTRKPNVESDNYPIASGEGGGEHPQHHHPHPHPPAAPAVENKLITAQYTNIYIATGFSVTVILLILFVCWRRKCVRNQKNTTIRSPIVLKQSLLESDRYARNPQYSACNTTNTVPLLQRETLQFLNEIGEGCFGKVFKGQLLTEGNDEPEIVAIKVLKESASTEAEDDFLREVDIMSAFRHSNILSLLGVVLRDSSSGPNSNNTSPMMVFEYMPHGDLAELLRVQKRRRVHDDPLPSLTTSELLSIALQIAEGMQYLAGQRFVHRDLACRNCLVSAGPIVKIADFGMSRDVYTCDYYKIGGTRLLPVRWMSPESVMYGRFTLESDIWSYGVVLWEIYSYGRQPYYGHTNEQVVRLILQDIMLLAPDECPAHVCDLMRQCWKTEPRDRIRFGDVCERLTKIIDANSSVNNSGGVNNNSHGNSNSGNNTNSSNGGSGNHSINNTCSSGGSSDYSVNSTNMVATTTNNGNVKSSVVSSNSDTLKRLLVLPRPPPLDALVVMTPPTGGGNGSVDSDGATSGSDRKYHCVVDMADDVDVLDRDGYLVPNVVKNPVTYLETF